jgi:hypothetical protein
MSDAIWVAAIAAVPAGIAALGSWRASSHSKEAAAQVKTSNGDTLAEIVERIDFRSDANRRTLVRHMADAVSHATPDLENIDAIMAESDYDIGGKHDRHE